MDLLQTTSLRAIRKGTTDISTTDEVDGCEFADEFRGEGQQQKCESFSLGNDNPLPLSGTIQELFSQQAEKIPDVVAVVHEHSALTYSELNRRSTAVSSHLRAKGIGPDSLVGICLERGLDMFVAILGALKAGGAYVPLDPEYPDQRIAYIVEETAPKVVLTQRKLLPKLSHCVADLITMDEGSTAQLSTAEESGNLISIWSDRNLAYVMYTSGSTGRPKGVMIDHASVVTLWRGLELIYRRVQPCKRVALNASFNFDASVQQLVQLLSGRTLFLVSRDARRNAAEMLRFLERYGIDGIDCTPSQLRGWVSAGLLRGDRPRPHLVLVGGEAIDGDLWQRLLECRHISFWNVYGPTECTVDSSSSPIGPLAPRPNIGGPMADRRVYILDPTGCAVSAGASGEIYIGGRGIARGYLNRPDLTAERFLPDRYSDEPSARVYRTGDLGRWCPDGSIEYLGRNDAQVKIRGFRIELGEIEAQLSRHLQVERAVVVAREDIPGDKRLVAYLVIAAGHRAKGLCPEPETLRAYLSLALPDYMLPSAFVVMGTLPLTPSGKLDRRALPVPEMGSFVTRPYEPPIGEKEVILVELLQDLLKISRVGRTDNFFELGGHSLLIGALAERLARRGLALNVVNVFNSPTVMTMASTLGDETTPVSGDTSAEIPDGCHEITPEMVSLVALSPRQLERIAESVPGGMRNVQDIYPLAPLQEGVLFHHLLDETKGDPYIVSTLLKIDSRARLEEWLAALQEVIDHHDALRTAVVWEELPQPVQVVYRTATLPVDEVALPRSASVGEQVNAWVKPESQRIDVRQAPLMRVQFAEDPSTGECYLLLQVHHLISDHVTEELMACEVVLRLEGRTSSISPSGSYKRHVAQALAYARSTASEAFFRSKFQSLSEITLPFGLRDAVCQPDEILIEVEEDVDPSLAMRIRAQARRLSISSATVFHAAWAIVVAHASGREDVVFGTLLLGRLLGKGEAAASMGMYINTLPLRIRVCDNTARQLIEQTHRELADLLTYEQASLATVQRCSGLQGNASLFSTLFNYRHSSAGAIWDTATGLKMLSYQERTTYPIMMSVDDIGSGFKLTAQAVQCVSPRRITGYLSRAVRSLVDALEYAPESPVGTLAVMPHQELRQLVEAFNATTMDYGKELLIHELIERQVAQTPEAIAVVHGNDWVSYAELNRKANQLASYLRSEGVGPEVRVGVCVERGIDMVIALLAILKAGGAYVPLDPAYPSERLTQILADATPKIVLVHVRLRNRLPPNTTKSIPLDAEWSRIARHSAGDVQRKFSRIDPGHLAYLIYTSGSTGQPKGVMIEHRNAFNLILWARLTTDESTFQRTLQSTSLNFDLSVYECFVPLSLGASIRVVENALAIVKDGFDVTLINTVPSAIKGVMEAATLSESVRAINLAGERLKGEVVESIYSHSGVDRVCNLYGPSETTTYSTCVSMTREEGFVDSIGRPIANTQIYILNRSGQVVPMGVVGEIFIGGAGVARGYLNRPELTAERFVASPFSIVPGMRMYRTGDLGRWRDDGTIEYLGRNDHQIKIRGYRVEPGEIESRLLEHEQVKEASVIGREDSPGEMALVAYVIPVNASAPPDSDELGEFLRKGLPSHMVPGKYVMLEHFPLTSNGKLNRSALPAPESVGSWNETNDSPKGEVELLLAQLWVKYLRLERVGRTDNLFRLGGHSIVAMLIAAGVESRLSISLPLREVLEFPVLKDIALRIEALWRARLADEAGDSDNQVQRILEQVARMPDRAVLDALAAMGRE